MPLLELRLAREKDLSKKYLEMILALGYSMAEIETGKLLRDNMSEMI